MTTLRLANLKSDESERQASPYRTSLAQQANHGRDARATNGNLSRSAAIGRDFTQQQATHGHSATGEGSAHPMESTSSALSTSTSVSTQPSRVRGMMTINGLYTDAANP